MGPEGEGVTEYATTMHVLGGQCKAIEHGSAMRESMYEAIQELAKVTARKVENDTAEQQDTASNGRRNKKGRGRTVATEASNVAHAAKNAVKKGKEATDQELRCLRTVLAGHMPRREEGERSQTGIQSFRGTF